MAAGNIAAQETRCRADPFKASGRPRSSPRLVLAIALCLGAALVTGCGSATPAPSTAASSLTTAPPTAAASTQASPSATDPGTFASTRYGYSVVLPPEWQTQPAVVPWLSGALEGRCPATWDCLSDISGEPTLAVAATKVAAVMTLDRWRGQMRTGVPSGCVDSKEWTATTLGGEPAHTWTTTCKNEELHATKVAALHDGRGYMVLFASPISIGLETDRATLSSILATFRFASS
jgi:hypothetical protein